MGRKKKKKSISKELEKEIEPIDEEVGEVTQEMRSSIEEVDEVSEEIDSTPEEVEKMTEDNAVVILDETQQGTIVPDRPKDAPLPEDCIVEYYNARKNKFIFKLKNHRKIEIDG